MQFPITNLPIPEPLLHIPQAPKRLLIRGTFPDIKKYKFLTVVGSRNFTSYGEDACRTLIAGLKGYPVVIVSGLANGIDRISHEAALDTGLITVSFPGSGLDDTVLYPKAQYQLAMQILHSGGALVSEFDNDFKSTLWSFVQRNRLMAGLSHATLVIEAKHKSGTRITAKLATDYNRDVLAVPGSIFSENSEATNELIRMGATPITSSVDILEALGFEITTSTPADLFSQCSPDEASVINLLTSAKPRGELMREMNIPTHKANILLSQMELKGLIKEVGGEIRRV
jgi:DNA processing protein